MHSQQSPDWQVLDRYLAGEATPQEVGEVRAWVGDDGTRAAALELLRQQGGVPVERWNVGTAWSRFTTERLGGSIAVQAAPPRRLRLSPRVMQIAASLLVVAGAVVLWRVTARRNVERVLTDAELTTTNGNRESFTLIDGTRVTLNAGSRLRHGAGFSRSGRDVTLDGEGFFDVAADAARPFRVHAHGGVVEDFGTRFAVRAYPELPELEVVVVEGRVVLRRDNPGADSVVLAAGQLGALAGAGPPSARSVASVEKYLDWTRGALTVDGTLGRAIPELERWYDVDIVLGDSALAARTLWASFKRENVEQAMGAIARALRVRYVRAGRRVTFTSTL